METADSTHVSDLIIRIRHAMLKMPYARTLKEERAVVTDMLSQALLPFCECFGQVVQLGEEDWSALCWNLYLSSVLGTKSSNALPRIANSVADWTSASLEARDIMIGRVVGVKDRGSLWLWSLACLAASVAVFGLAHTSLIESERGKVVLLWSCLLPLIASLIAGGRSSARRRRRLGRKQFFEEFFSEADGSGGDDD